MAEVTHSEPQIAHPTIGSTRELQSRITRPSVFLHLLDGTDIRIMDNIPLRTIREIGSQMTPLERSLWKIRLQWIGENL